MCSAWYVTGTRLGAMHRARDEWRSGNTAIRHDGQPKLEVEWHSVKTYMR